MTWTSVGEEIMMWRYLEEKIFFLSASSFNLYYRLLRRKCNFHSIGSVNCHFNPLNLIFVILVVNFDNMAILIISFIVV